MLLFYQQASARDEIMANGGSLSHHHGGEGDVIHAHLHYRTKFFHTLLSMNLL